MKGIVFSEFIELVEERFSPEVADAIIVAADLPSGGAYTAVGTYDHREMAQLVANLSRETGVPAPDLLGAFGEHLFGRFHTLYPVFFEGVDDAFGFLLRLEDTIHAEVRKLYPDADLPRFDYDTSVPGRLVLDYRSARCLGDLAEGLIRGCIAYYGEPMRLTREPLEGEGAIRFVLERTV